MDGSLILVTGATGTVGSEVVRRLTAAGHRVRALVRDNAKAAAFGTDVEVVVADLMRPQSLTAAFDGVQRAFILAPPAPELEKMEINAFIAAEQGGVDHIVYLSNFGAGAFDHEPWAAHGANEWRLRALRSTWTILRPTRFMSSVPFAWTSVREGGRLSESLAGRKVVMVDPHDIAAVAVTTLTRTGHEAKIYELSGQALTGPEIAASLSAALGRSVEFTDASNEETRDALLASGFPLQLVDFVLFYLETLRADRWYETSTVEALLGRPPRTFDDWLREQI